MNDYNEKRLDIAIEESEKYYEVMLVKVIDMIYHISTRNIKLKLDFLNNNYEIVNSNNNYKLETDNYPEALYKYTKILEDY